RNVPGVQPCALPLSAPVTATYDAVEDVLLLGLLKTQGRAGSTEENTAQTVGLQLVAPCQLIGRVLVGPGPRTVELHEDAGLSLHVMPVLMTEQKRVHLGFVASRRGLPDVLHTQVQPVAGSAVERGGALGGERTTRAVSGGAPVHPVGRGVL